MKKLLIGVLALGLVNCAKTVTETAGVSALRPGDMCGNYPVICYPDGHFYLVNLRLPYGTSKACGFIIVNMGTYDLLAINGGGRKCSL
jgi:hypothetical protein